MMIRQWRWFLRVVLGVRRLRLRVVVGELGTWGVFLSGWVGIGYGGMVLVVVKDFYVGGGVVMYG